jgi:uncharacterized protein (UPF0335 family)
MTAGGSLQLRQYRIARRDGATVEDACATSGIPASEARLIEADDAKNPPPPEAFELLGHNSGEKPMSDNANIKDDHLRLLVERIERLESEKKGIADDIKDVYGEAKSTGYDTPAIRRIIRERKIDKTKRDEAQAVYETYAVQLGLF